MDTSINYQKPKIVAEIGCNHKGDFEIAKELILLAKESKATYAKFQKRNPKELLTDDQYNSPHPNPMHSFGQTYGEHREKLELPIEQHRELFDFCNEVGIKYSTSVWDITSAIEIISLNPDFIKVPSACNNNFDLLEVLRDQYHGEIHVSFGMTTHAEEESIIDFFSQHNKGKDRLVIYSCTSGYPVPFEDVCLLEIKRMREAYKDKVRDFGFSGHHLGIAIDNAAYTLGANWIERHFTKDRTWKGTDHAASLEPPGLSKLVRDLNATSKCLTFKQEQILEIESIQREKLKFRK